MELGGAAGIHGARLSGYGGGGVVTVLAGPDSDSGIDQLCSTYEQEMGLTPAVYPARD
jgi:galactokinase